MSGYAEFLARKAILDPPTGLSAVPDLPERLFPFQRDITTWALKRGRAAIFAETGLGKSFMELAWADAVHRETGGDILHLAPLAVSAQMQKDEAHISPLQLDVIERCIDLWSMPGDVVLTPFLGIGSEVFGAIEMGRRGIGFELKPSYFKQAVKNLREARDTRVRGDLISAMEAVA